MTRPRFGGALAFVIAMMAAPAALASGDSHGPSVEVHLFYLIDFLVLVGLLWWFARKPAKKFLVDRHDAVRKEMDEAMALKAEAGERVSKYEAMLANLDAEITEIRAQFRRDGLAERDRIVSEARAAAERMRRGAQQELAIETAKLRANLERDITARALELAETRIRQRMNAPTQKALVHAFIRDLESRDGLRRA